MGALIVVLLYREAEKLWWNLGRTRRRRRRRRRRRSHDKVCV